MVRRTKEDSEKTRETLLDAAEHVFLEKGVAASSLQDIARYAGMTRGAVYWHFENKQALFNAMHERVKLPMDDLFERAVNDGDSFTALKDLCVTVLHQLAEDARVRRVFTILILKCEETCPEQSNVERQQQRRQEIIGKFEKVFTTAKKKGQLSPGISPLNAAVALHAYIGGIFQDYLRHPDALDIAKSASSIVDIFFNGLQGGTK